MSGCLNEVNLIGNLTKDPELRSTQAGKQIANLTVATNESWKGADGERKERAEFHRVVIFNEALAKVASQYLSKGSKLFVRGQLQTRKWTDKDGQDRYSTEVVIQGFGGVMLMLDSKGADDSQPRQKHVAVAPASELLDDGIEF